MTPVEIALAMPGEGTGAIMAFVCGEPTCNRFYNIIHGYFEIIAGSISPSPATDRRSCADDGLPMYLAHHGADGVNTYRCSQYDCDGSKMVQV